MNEKIVKVLHETVEEPKSKFDKKGNPTIYRVPDEMDPDFVAPEEKSGIIDSGRNQMTEDEFDDFSSRR